jgi:hypothetical protein
MVFKNLVSDADDFVEVPSFDVVPGACYFGGNKRGQTLFGVRL